MRFVVHLLSMPRTVVDPAVVSLKGPDVQRRSRQVVLLLTAQQIQTMVRVFSDEEPLVHSWFSTV